MGSGVFLAIVVVLWFIVLVPMVLNRGELAREAARGDELSPSARILTRRSSAARAPRRFASMSRRETSPSLDAHVTADDDGVEEQGRAHGRSSRLAYDPAEAQVDTGVHERYVEDTADDDEFRDDPRPADPTRPRRTDAAREMMLVRRRRTLTVLGVLTVATLLLAILVTPMFWIAQGIVDLALIGYLSHLRNEASRERERAQHRAVRFAPSRPAYEAGGTDDWESFAGSAYPPAPSSDRARTGTTVRIDDEDPAFYELGDTAVAAKADLRGGYPTRRSVDDEARYDEAV